MQVLWNFDQHNIFRSVNPRTIGLEAAGPPFRVSNKNGTQNTKVIFLTLPTLRLITPIMLGQISFFLHNLQCL